MAAIISREARDDNIVRSVVEHGVTLAAAGKKYGLTRERARQILFKMTGHGVGERGFKMRSARSAEVRRNRREKEWEAGKAGQVFRRWERAIWSVGPFDVQIEHGETSTKVTLDGDELRILRRCAALFTVHAECVWVLIEYNNQGWLVKPHRTARPFIGVLPNVPKDTEPGTILGRNYSKIYLGRSMNVKKRK